MILSGWETLREPRLGGVTVHGGGIRELHWHPDADEWQLFISGTGKMTVFATGGRIRTMDFQAWDVDYIQKTLPHYVQNTGDTDLKCLLSLWSKLHDDGSLCCLKMRPWYNDYVHNDGGRHENHGGGFL